MTAHTFSLNNGTDVFDFELSADELATIDALDTGKRGGPELVDIILANHGRPIAEA